MFKNFQNLPEISFNQLSMLHLKCFATYSFRGKCQGSGKVDREDGNGSGGEDVVSGGTLLHLA